MGPETVLDVGRDALWMTVLLAGPLLGAALAVGLLIGIFQAATQIQEMTLSFIPKLLALVVALFIAGPWMIQVLVTFSKRLIVGIPGLIDIQLMLIGDFKPVALIGLEFGIEYLHGDNLKLTR